MIEISHANSLTSSKTRMYSEKLDQCSRGDKHPEQVIINCFEQRHINHRNLKSNSCGQRNDLLI